LHNHAFQVARLGGRFRRISGLFHAFAPPRGEPIDLLGHHIVFDVKAALDAQKRADAFMAAQMK